MRLPPWPLLSGRPGTPAARHPHLVVISSRENLARFAVLLALCIVSASLYAQSGATLLVLSKHDHTLAIVNPSTLQVIARVPVGHDPHARKLELMTRR